MAVLVKRTQFIKARTVGKSRPIRAVSNHLKYIEADKEKHRNKVTLFNQNHDQVDRKEFMEKIRNQKQHGVISHNLVFSLSQDEKERLGIDMKELVRDSLERYESKHKTKLDWVGAYHNDEGHPHVHVVVRGRDENNKSVYIDVKRMKEMARFGEMSKERQAERTQRRGKEVKPEVERDFFLQELEQERHLAPVTAPVTEIERERELALER